MKKQIILIAIFLAFLITSCNSVNNNEGVYDEEAVVNLDKISERIGELNSVSYTLNTFVEEANADGDLDQFSNTHDVYLRGPNKMHIHTKGTKGEKKLLV